VARKVICVVGTRPEVIKMAPVVRRLRELGPALEVRLLSTGQHRGLLDRALDDFGLVADRDLGLMVERQGLAELTSRALAALSAEFAGRRPDLVIAQGDTTTVLCAALACSYTRTPFAHVEAGLRSGRRDEPFPEETNRVLVSHLASLQLAPTPLARANLLREGIDPGTIHVTGNTVVDALGEILRLGRPHGLGLPAPRFLLVTVHRRENHGLRLAQVAQAIRCLVRRHADLGVVLPLHPNPAVREALTGALSGVARVLLAEPLEYPRFLDLMRSAALILSDSGGVQEEATVLGKTVLVLRETTERPEAVASGHARVVGTARDAIVAAAEAAMSQGQAAPPRPGADGPFGDGRAAIRIARAVAGFLGIDPGPAPAGLADWPAPVVMEP
jgi:UDP-N-acetylglucosamine 2-epimerase (non-hydrolysing)